MEDLIITMAFGTLISAVKNPAKKASLKKAFLKVFNLIKANYADDPDFQS
ncbi:MAG: hypothetical protein ACREJN_08865 [Nitrospiraceae bacterium]